MVDLKQTPIVIVIVCYVASFFIMGVQTTLGDPMGIELMIFDKALGGFGSQDDGTTFTSSILEMTDKMEACHTSGGELIGCVYNMTYTTELDCHFADNTNVWMNSTGSSFSTLNEQTYNMRLTMTDEPSVVNNPIASAASIAYQLFGIITGTYIFNILMFFGIPYVFVAGIIMVYVILLGYTIITLLRGI